MGSCPVPVFLAALMPFFIAMFRNARRKPPVTEIKPIRRVAGQYLPKQRIEEPVS